ncbi:hypothetical protein [Pasteuria penetrans]|uniref:hypothetical protein n=1 Tax=Pasteuria penetrans TaxID=86005 RepID=UPI0011F04C9C|nr:hypothetical protein [Pasteuria penetrans]
MCVGALTKSLTYCGLFLLLRLSLHGWGGFKDYCRKVGSHFIRLRSGRKKYFLLAQQQSMTKLRWFSISLFGVTCFLSSLGLFLYVYSSVWILTAGIIGGCVVIQWQRLREQRLRRKEWDWVACMCSLKTEFIFSSAFAILYIMSLHTYNHYGSTLSSHLFLFSKKVLVNFIDFIGPFFVFPCWLHMILGKKPSLLESERNMGWYDELWDSFVPLPLYWFLQVNIFRKLFFLLVVIMAFFLFIIIAY